MVFTDMPADWPGRAHSQRIDHDGRAWHIQQFGQGPLLLLVHGTGGSTHSWAACADALTATFTVLAVDLPGHGFTQPVPSPGPNQRSPDDAMGLDGMSRALGGLLRALNASPHLAAGHSAGVPILMQLALDGYIAPTAIVGFNPALVPPPPLYVTLLAPLVGLLVERDVVAQSGAWLARATSAVDLVLSTSGTTLTPEQRARYRWLCERPQHVHAALTMMARWNLPQLLRDALALRVPLSLVGGTRDQWVPPSALSRVIERLPMARFSTVDAGHLIPEEKPDEVISALLGGQAA